MSTIKSIFRTTQLIEIQSETGQQGVKILILLIYKIRNNLTSGINFYNTVKFCIHETIYIVFEGIFESDVNPDTTMFNQIEMIARIRRQIRGQIEGKKAIATLEGLSRNTITSIEIVQPDPGEQRMIRFYKQIVIEIWLQMSRGDLNPVDAKREIIQVEMFKIKWVSRASSVIGLIFDKSANYSPGDSAHKYIVNRLAENSAMQHHVFDLYPGDWVFG